MTTMTVIPEMAAVGNRKKAHSENLDPAQEALHHYVSCDYPIDLVRDDGIYVASHPDLPGCISMGDTPNDAVESLREVRALWIEGQLASGHSIPEPSKATQYSGKFVLRIPKLLHQMADRRARQEGVSLNSYVSSVLAGALNFAVKSTDRADFKETPSHEVWKVDHLWTKISQDCYLNSWVPPKQQKSLKHLEFFRHELAAQVGNSSKAEITLTKFEDHHRAQEKSLASSS